MKTPEQIKTYHVVFKNKFVSNVNPEEIQQNFVSKFNVPEKFCSKIFSGRRVRIKKGLSQQAALILQDKLFKTGMLCDIELDIDQKSKQEVVSSSVLPKTKQKIVALTEEEEDDDDDLEADFELSELLMEDASSDSESKNTANIVEVIKYHENNIVDIKYLKHKDRYTDTDNRFCLAEHDRKHKAYFYFDEFMRGNCYDAQQNSVETEKLCTYQNMYHKKKRIYRHPVPDQGYVSLSNDVYTYYIRKKSSQYLPPERMAKRPKLTGIKHVAKSIVCHLLVIMLIGMFVSFEDNKTIEKRHFAKIAGNKIHDLQKLRKKQREIRPPQKMEIVQHPKKTVDSVKKVKPVKVADSVNILKPVKKAQKQLSKKRITPKNISKNTNRKSKNSGQQSHGRTGKQSVARHSGTKGNGGGNIGNVSTPDVNQKGILGMIKDTGLSLLNTTEALAAVTQLDTVDVPGNFDKNTLKINGIKGNLGNRKVQMPLNTDGGRVNTKGAHQVLRTGGGDGSGGKGSGVRVGELAKGNTGHHAVKAMIRANFTQSVHQIQGGGMSRAAVKKVIDQHIDDITYCYEVALISDPSIVGKAVYEWRILMNGSVGDVHILNASIQNQEILGCIKKSIKTWSFPKPHRAQVMVSYPFVFDIVGF
jgi:hypothetical protein